MARFEEVQSVAQHGQSIWWPSETLAMSMDPRPVVVEIEYDSSNNSSQDS